MTKGRWSARLSSHFEQGNFPSLALPQKLWQNPALKTFLAELKRRNVYKVAIAYIVGGWALSQGLAQVLPVFDVPIWGIRFIVLLIIVGFPVALLVAWFFELTPEGLKRTEDVDPTKAHAVNGPWIYVVVIGMAISIGLFFLGRYSATARQNMAGRKSIAVLPLLNESGNPQDEYFSDGLSDELIAALGQIGGLKVIGRSSSFRFKDRKEEPKVIGEKLGVTTLLEGTIRKQGDRVRIVAALVNAADGVTLWTRTFDRELKDIFALQEEIARAVADSLKVTLLGAGATSVQAAASSSVEAHNAYLQAHYHLLQRNLEAYRKAIGYFDEAIRLDPNYALAYAERCEALTLVGDLAGERPVTYPKARNDAEKAVALAPSLAEAHAALGWVRFFVEWKFAERLAELQRAKDLSPANPTANDLLGRVIVYGGRFDEAERQVRYGVEIDPLSVSAYFNLARVLFNAGKLEESEAAGNKVAELQPTASSSHRFQLLVAVQRSDGQAVLREANLEPDENFHRFGLALAYYLLGDGQKADAALADLIAHAHDRLAYQIAEVYAVRGEADKTFEWLQTAFDQRDGGTLSLLVDPLLRNFHGDPRYKNLVIKLGMPSAK